MREIIIFCEKNVRCGVNKLIGMRSAQLHNNARHASYEASNSIDAQIFPRLTRNFPFSIFHFPFTLYTRPPQTGRNRAHLVNAQAQSG